jgi:hypothetical protein
VTHYSSFYVLDEDVGLAFITVCSSVPFEAKVCFNGHAWAKRQLTKAGIAFTPLENGVAGCADPGRVQAICHALTAAPVQAVVDPVVDHLPWPLTPAERAAGDRHAWSVWQLEVSRTQVVADPGQGRALVETLIRDHLDLGRPDRVRLIFDRTISRRTPGAFQTDVLQYGVLPSIRIPYQHSARKQYRTEGRALRTEMMINNPRDFGIDRGLAQVDAVVALGQAINGRLLEQEQVSQDGLRSLEQVRQVGESTVTADGQRASAMRFGDPRALAGLAALVQWAGVPAGVTTKTLRPLVAALLNRADYHSAQMSYDLRRLRLKGLIERRAKSHSYALTPLGTPVAVFFTKLATRVFEPGVTALLPTSSLPTP